MSQLFTIKPLTLVRVDGTTWVCKTPVGKFMVKLSRRKIMHVYLGGSLISILESGDLQDAEQVVQRHFEARMQEGLCPAM